MRTPLLVAALAATLLAGTAVTAQTTAPAPADATARPLPPPPGGGRMLRRADANGDGVVTRAEAQAEADQRFARLDADHDGIVTAAERQAAFEAMRARRGEDGANAPVPPPGGFKRAPGMGRRADPDAKGVITQAEWRARADRRFDGMDANHDGRLDAGELAAMRGPRHGPDAPPPVN